MIKTIDIFNEKPMSSYKYTLIAFSNPMIANIFKFIMRVTGNTRIADALQGFRKMDRDSIEKLGFSRLMWVH